MRHMDKVHGIDTHSKLKATLEKVARRNQLQKRIAKIDSICRNIGRLASTDLQKDLEIELSNEEIAIIEKIFARAAKGTEKLAEEIEPITQQLKAIKKGFFKKRVKI